MRGNRLSNQIVIIIWQFMYRGHVFNDYKIEINAFSRLNLI